MPIKSGLQSSVDHVVSDADTAAALGSGDVAVLGTPAVLALCESAAVRAVGDALDRGQTTVGIRVELEHLAATVPGIGVTARARLERVDDRTLHFAIEASDASGVIARGTHSRVIVDRDRFLDRARERG